MTTRAQSKILTSGKLRAASDLCGRGVVPLSKLILYLPPGEMVALQAAIEAVISTGVSSSSRTGNHPGVALAAIARQWTKGRAK